MGNQLNKKCFQNITEMRCYVIISTMKKADSCFIRMVDMKVELNRYAEKSNPVHKQSI